MGLDVAALPPHLLGATRGQVLDVLCRTSPAVWAEVKRGFTNAPVHREWYGLMRQHARLAVVAPRDHAKTEVFTVNGTAWRSIYQPGCWSYVFASTKDQAEGIKERIDSAIAEVEPVLMERASVKSKRESVYANGSRVTVAGAGKAVRSAHPDVVIGDDVLEEQLCLSSHQRRKTHRWWFGTVSNMAHPGVVRAITAGGITIHRRMPATRIILVGTPFHERDLLLSMRSNPIYKFRRYAAEYDPADLVDGLAVEVG